MLPGISGQGKSAEDQFRAITGAVRADRVASGDAVLDGHLVEVKKATTNTLNQVRAVKYLAIAVWFEPTNSWYVIPAHRVVACIARKTRGQHQENPFECATVGLSEFGDCLVSSADLRAATLAAITQSDGYQELRDEMAAVLKDARQSAYVARQRVTRLLVSLGLA